MTWPFNFRNEEAKKEMAVIAKVNEAKLDKEVEQEAKQLVEELGDKITLEEATTYLRAIKRPMPFADKLAKLKEMFEKAASGGGSGVSPLDRALGMWDVPDRDSKEEAEPRTSKKHRRKRERTKRTADQEALSSMGVEIREPELILPKI